MKERQHYNIPRKIVFVRGNIILKHKLPKNMMDLGCCFKESEIENIHQIIEGDFIIEDDTETFEDAYYYASGGVTAFDHTGGFSSRYYLVENYDKAIDDIIALSNLDIGEDNGQLLQRILFANVYSSMEAFLQDTCMYYLRRDQRFKETFLKSQESLSKEKIYLSEIFDKISRVDYKIQNAVENTVFHRLSQEICPLFKNTFGIAFPDYKYIDDNLTIRHDIVHRNGCSKDKSKFHIISKDQLYELIEKVDKFVHALFDEFEKLK
ncbi:MAG TPA: hypothetical protein DDZ57_08285 [Porphyromonadaceae bacterium]|nr:hypothetical protein [Porphyromonadaceae bacterium]